MLRRDAGAARGWRVLAALLPLVALERAVFIFWIHPPSHHVHSDMEGYVSRAWRLADASTRVGPADTFFAPGTHVLMAPLMRLAGSVQDGMRANQWLWWVLSVGTLWAVALLTLRLFRHPAAAVVMLVATLVYLPFSTYAGYFLSENPFSFFLVTALLAGHVASGSRQWGWRNAAMWGVTGLLSGVAMTLRPQFALSLVVLALPLLRRTAPFVHWRAALALGGMAAIPLLGAVALNSAASGRLTGMSSNGGFNFYQGHCDVHTVETRTAGGVYVWASPATVQFHNLFGLPASTTVIEGHDAWDNAFFFDKGLQCVWQDGWRHIGRLLLNEANLFFVVPWPQSESEAAVTVAVFNHGYSIMLLLMVLPMSWRRFRHRTADRWLRAQLMAVLPLGLLFYGDSRFRIPYDLLGLLLWVGLVAAHYGFRRDPP